MQTKKKPYLLAGRPPQTIFFTIRKWNKNKICLQRALHGQSQIKGKTGMAIATGHAEAAPNWVLSGYITLSKMIRTLMKLTFSCREETSFALLK